MPALILHALRRGAFRLVSSPDLTAEVADVLNRPRVRERFRLHPEEIDALVGLLVAATVEPLALDALPVHCRDPKDDPVLARALGGRTDYLVTGDADLLALDGDPALGALHIVTPRAFLALLNASR